MSYEQIVLAFRTLADKSRLRVLLLLAVHEELTASAIADKARLSRANASFHLKMLCASGLVVRRRAGAWIFHSLRSGESGGWLGSLVRTIREGVHHCGVKQLRNYQDLTSPRVEALADALFRVATAFTSVRRLLLISQLHRKPYAPQDLLRAVPMSDWALARHLAKLSSRGYLDRLSAEERDCLRIPRSFESRIQARVLSAVLQALDLMASRTSGSAKGG